MSGHLVGKLPGHHRNATGRVSTGRSQCHLPDIQALKSLSQDLIPDQPTGSMGVEEVSVLVKTFSITFALPNFSNHKVSPLSSLQVTISTILLILSAPGTRILGKASLLVRDAKYSPLALLKSCCPSALRNTFRHCPSSSKISIGVARLLDAPSNSGNSCMPCRWRTLHPPCKSDPSEQQQHDQPRWQGGTVEQPQWPCHPQPVGAPLENAHRAWALVGGHHPGENNLEKRGTLL